MEWNRSISCISSILITKTDSKMLTRDFNQTIDFWIKELEHYSFTRLCDKPAPNTWSMGQLYMHLIENTHYFFEQINICVSANDNDKEDASSEAKNMFQNNDFPNEMIEGPPSNLNTPQPESKEQLLSALIQLKAGMNNAAALISKSICKGKTKHPGLNYFSAHEWFQFAEMHFRHHLRQKKRLDDYLAIGTRQDKNNN